MPGPGGGGGSGGGGFGGGSFGGNFGGSHNGGSFSGSHKGYHRHGTVHIGRGWRGYGYGGGCGGNLITVLLVGLFILFAGLYAFFPDEGINLNGDEMYSESVMQDYANEKYKQYFGSASAYEDNILLVFLSNEEADGYYTIAWVGDNIDYSINEMFGEYGEYGSALSDNINTDYFGYSLDTDLARVIDEMTKSIEALGLESSFVSESDRTTVPASEFVNLTGFDLTADVVDAALNNFTAKTGIPCVIVADYAERVFGVYEEDVTVVIPGSSVQAVTPDGNSAQATVSQSNTGKVVSVRELSLSTVAIAVLGIMAVIGLTVAVTIRVIKKKTNPQKEKSKEEKPPWEL